MTDIPTVIDEINNTDEAELERQLRCIDIAKSIVSDTEKQLARKLSYHVTTFGCQMNARDSEKLKGVLEACGYIYEEDEQKADFVIYNTCTVRDNANQKLYGHLGSLGAVKKKRPDMIIGLCGCLTQEKSAYEKIMQSFSFVDLIFGTHNLFDFPRLLVKVLTRKNSKGKGHTVSEIWDSTDRIVEDIPVRRNYKFKSGVNIMFGCNNFCSYCIVPYVRGRERSRPGREIIGEIQALADDGVKEVMLLGQNVNSYGRGLDEEITFAGLLRMVEKIDGIERIRFMTSHPKDLSDELIDVMESSSKICRHIHLPLQSGSTRILEAMNRHYTKEQYIALADKIRDRIPGIAITTDIIVGFPGETADDIDDTIDVIEKVGFDGAFTFIYSKRSGTPAAMMPDQVSEEDVKAGFDRVLAKVQETSTKRAALIEGQVMDVLVEDINRQDGSLVTGRLSNNLNVHFPGDGSLIGKIVPVRLAQCKGFYYIGEMIHNHF
ncbi:MAG: tRNA (N6-isopentenyl adenosine(37)-C2)-methylthiotransferase MiaB [Lachnospiraceae bacterium]|nr:tRNA (N6-isopentenyl adenosine(37)-C2)-methylthiotransferase MiaB [Lachnospiraceae bacterium]